MYDSMMAVDDLRDESEVVCRNEVLDLDVCEVEGDE